MIYISRIFIIFCIFFPFALPAHAVQAVTSNGETFLAEASGKFKVQVRIKAHEIPIGNQSEKRPDKIESNCTYSKYPCSLVDVLEISINGKLLFVPRSSFCSFSDLNFVKLQLTKKGYVLTLEGGDASEGYIGRIVFNHKRVISRAVSSALAPNYILEETIYKKQVEEFN